MEVFLFIISTLITVTTYYIVGKLILKKDKNNIFDQIIFGIISLAALAIIINFFYPLNKFLNSIIQILIIIFYFLFFKKKISLKEIKCIILISLSVLILIIYDTENRPDAYLYHLPYSQTLNDHKIILGLSNLHFRFSHISIFQYLASFNITIWSGLDGLLIPSAAFCVTIFFYFLNDIKKINNNEIFYGKLFSLLFFIYICLRINRFGEFGNDAMAHLTIFYLVSKFIYLKIEKINTYKKILTLSIFAFLNKPFLIFSFIFPIYLILKNKIKINLALINLPILFLILWLVKNLLISGCLLFPLDKTCIKKLKWTNKVEFHNQVQINAEAWAKGWVQRNDKKISIENFIKNLNWISAWKDEQSKNFIKNLLPYLISLVLIFIFFRGNNYINNNNDREKKIILLLFSLIGSIYFIYKFPLYRYGYSYLIVIINIIFISFFNRVNFKKIQKFSKIIISLCVFLLISKQIIRVHKYHNLRSIIPSDRNLNLENRKNIQKIILSNNFNYYYSPVECKYFKSPCTNYLIKNVKHKEVLGYNIIFKE